MRNHRLRCAARLTITAIVTRTSANAPLPIAALDVLLRCGYQVDLDTAEPNDRDQRLAAACCLQLDQPQVREEHHLSRAGLWLGGHGRVGTMTSSS